MGKSQSFNEYAMIQSALIETRRKIEAREESNERTKEKLLAEEDTVKRGKLLEQIENEKKNIEREKKLLKSLEEKAEKTAKKGNLSEEDKRKAQNLANKGNEKATEKNVAEKNETRKPETGETGKNQTGSKTENNVNENSKTDAKEAKRTPEKESKEDKRDDRNSFNRKNKVDLSLQLADARERLHIAEDHFKNSLNTQGQNAFVRTRKEE